jgi:hypothetical protein
MTEMTVDGGAPLVVARDFKKYENFTNFGLRAKFDA